jgi:hypothetical protein
MRVAALNGNVSRRGKTLRDETIRRFKTEMFVREVKAGSAGEARPYQERIEAAFLPNRLSVV